MKTQLSKPARHKARYTEEYKKEALELWRPSGRSAAKVAAELGIRAPLLYRWAQWERQPEAAAAESKAGRSVTELEEEIPCAYAQRTLSSWSSVKFKKNLWASSPKCRREVCPDRTARPSPFHESQSQLLR